MKDLAAKVHIISLSAYRFPGVFIGYAFFICIASAFVRVSCDSFAARSFLTYSSTALAPHVRTISGVIPLSKLSKTTPDPPGVNPSFIISSNENLRKNISFSIMMRFILDQHYMALFTSCLLYVSYFDFCNLPQS